MIPPHHGKGSSVPAPVALHVTNHYVQCLQYLLQKEHCIPLRPRAMLDAALCPIAQSQQGMHDHCVLPASRCMAVLILEEVAVFVQSCSIMLVVFFFWPTPIRFAECAGRMSHGGGHDQGTGPPPSLPGAPYATLNNPVGAKAGPQSNQACCLLHLSSLYEMWCMSTI